MIKYFIIFCIFLIQNPIIIDSFETSSLDDLFGGSSSISNTNSHMELFDLDSSLYGKPTCTNIPSNMSLCNNINYKQMRMPNLLGHETMDEVEYQSSVWVPLLSVNCHKDAQMFLCSLFAPVCVEQAQAAIYPCRSLCESVKNSCEGPMLSYNYPWPSMFNCSKFPVDNGLCIQPSSQMATEEMTTSISTKTTTTRNIPIKTTTKETFTNTTTAVSTITKKPANIVNTNICRGCQDENPNMETIVNNYCQSDFAFRGRIQSIKISRVEVSPMRARNMNKRVFNNSLSSLFTKVVKRDRKILKGARLLNSLILNKQKEYLDQEEIEENEDDFDYEERQNKDIDLFLMSEFHLNIGGLNRQNKNKQRVLRQNSMAQRKPHCTCEKLRKNLRKSNMKYFITASLLKTKNLILNFNNEKNQSWKHKRQGGNDTIINEKKKLAKNNQQTKLVYMTSVVQWNKARALIDYLEDDSIDKTNMCKNVKTTVREINRAQKRLF